VLEQSAQQKGHEVKPDNVITLEEVIFLVVFAFLVFVVPFIVVRKSYAEGDAFDVRSIWEHHGRIDKFAVIIMVTWWIHTCSIILWTLLRTITTTDYATYMGWAIPIVMKMFAGNETSSTTTAQSSSTTVTTPVVPPS